MTKKIVFVVDSSGSMNGRYQGCIDSFLEASAHNVDEYDIKVCTFNNTVRWYSDDWTKMPDAEKLEEISAWLGADAPTGFGRDTFVIPALRQIYEMEEDDITIVIITDGGFTDRIMKYLEAQEKNLNIACIGVGANPRHSKILQEIGTKYRGGYFRNE